MRKAVVLGIDYYRSLPSLTGAVSDAQSVKAVLERHADGSPNFEVRIIVGTGPHNLVRRYDVREAIRALFAGDGEIALLYFAGHGHLETTGGYLCAGDCETGDDGVPIAEIMTLGNLSKMQNRIIMLDSCHSGIAGNSPVQPAVAEISDGVTILTASTEDQYANEDNGAGVFTSLLVDALRGSAANLVGDITPGGIYSHIDQSLGYFAQRPVFKANVKRFVSLRKVPPPLKLVDLRRISDLFPCSGFQYQLDPSYEPERPCAVAGELLKVPPPDPQKNAMFAVLQAYNRVGLVVPNGAPHMWHAAIFSKTVILTALGEHYRRLAAKGKI